ncbi:hypothetical protein CUC15_11615 [Oceanobacillus zhaokaii]|uniref:DUF1510 domain-containing protein n=1 Tax=Oceanobacillus zhaokaii TaxID=2052660 RepID=A0A345PHP9_9BACI|nr:YrrS family protein [Oceanobacillus zhaokaii]AXI09529.1 hypothetical protein CUC15_11615 [Oceanobacillus zhaokaii]
MSDMDRNTRLNKFEKRRKTTKSITILLIAGAFLIVVLLAFWLFGGGSDETDNAAEEPMEESSEIIINDDSKSNDESNNNTEKDEEAAEDESESTTPDEEEDTASDNEEVETEPAEPSDDNVAEAYVGEWEPVGTEQTGPHTTTYDEGSADREEMKQAVSVATGLATTDMIEWWYENGGDQKVIATVSDKAQTATYRVFITWIDGEGWQPTKVEKLIENDRKS